MRRQQASPGNPFVSLFSHQNIAARTSHTHTPLYNRQRTFIRTTLADPGFPSSGISKNVPRPASISQPPTPSRMAKCRSNTVLPLETIPPAATTAPVTPVSIPPAAVTFPVPSTINTSSWSSSRYQGARVSHEGRAGEGDCTPSHWVIGHVPSK